MPKSWFALDEFNQPHGPYSNQEMKGLLVERPDMMVWTQGMTDFAPVITVAAALADALPIPKLNVDGQPVSPYFNRRQNLRKSIDELIGICKGITFDGKVTADEIRNLGAWLNDNQHVLDHWPANVIGKRVAAILADGIVTQEEEEDLLDLLLKMNGVPPPTGTVEQLATRLPVDDPAPHVEFGGRSFCITGKFVFGARKKCEAEIEARGGIVSGGVSKDLDYLLIGTVASRDWLHSSSGTKIEKAVKYRDEGCGTRIVAEEHWVKFL
jgi:NAD-dependent DNA ligase